jgi:allene oxide cyclase-like protein
MKSVMAAGIVTAALLVSSCNKAGQSAGSSRTLRFFEHDTQQGSLDLGEKGTSPGDQFVYAGDLFDHRGGTKVGRAGGFCTTTSGDGQNAGEVSCTTNFVLASGQIVGEGLFDSADLFERGKTLPFPITGGTGIYRGARGEGTVEVPPDVPNETDANFVLHVSVP